jgi:hypothetical protein
MRLREIRYTDGDPGNDPSRYGSGLSHLFGSLVAVRLDVFSAPA